VEIYKDGPSTSGCASQEESMDDEWRDARQIKLRQMSSDSTTRDSGIAETNVDIDRYVKKMPVSLSARLPGMSFKLSQGGNAPKASLCGSVDKDFVYHVYGHEFESRLK